MIKIANTDLDELFPLGLGSVKAENGWSKEETLRMFDAYYDRGGNVYDSARIYSAFSKSEEYIGEWLKNSGKRNHIVLISKGGHPDISGPDPDMHISRLSKEDMIFDLDTSLRTLGADHLDIYLYHRDDEAIPYEELVDTMESFVKAGKIRYYGCSNWSLERMQATQEYCQKNGLRGFAMNQALLNAATDHSTAVWEDTLVKMDLPMRAYHKEHPEFLGTAYAGIAGGFFDQYLNGGEEAVRQKAYISEENFEIARQMAAHAKECGTTLLQETLRYFKTLDMPCLPLYTPRDIKSLIEAMEILE